MKLDIIAVSCNEHSVYPCSIKRSDDTVCTLNKRYQGPFIFIK